MSPEYLAAIRLSRLRMGALDRATARTILEEIRRWAETMSRWLASRPDDPARTSVAASREIIQRTALEMTGRIRRAALTNRDLAFEDILELQQRATLRVAGRKDIPNALLGGVRNPPVTLLAAQANRPGATTWQTLLQGHGQNAAAEAETIVRRALLDGVSPTGLAQRLRKYVTGSESFQGAFRRLETPTGGAWKIDLREIPQAARGQAAQMRSNAERIAVTEIHAARSDAEVLNYLHDPLIAAIQWTLSPDRGTQEGIPDVCDVLATANLYGLGDGAYPLHRVPGLPHPRDRCERNPIERPVHEAGQPKPTPPRVLLQRDVKVPRAGALTAAQHDRVRRQFETVNLHAAESAHAFLPLLGSTPRGRALAGFVAP